MWRDKAMKKGRTHGERKRKERTDERIRMQQQEAKSEQREENRGWVYSSNFKLH